MEKKEEHYYLHKGSRYENMKDAREALGITPRAFRFKVKAGEIQKITNNSSQQRQYENRNTEY